MIIFKTTKTLIKWFIKTNLKNQLYWKDFMMSNFEFRDNGEMTWKRRVVVIEWKDFSFQNQKILEFFFRRFRQ